MGRTLFFASFIALVASFALAAPAPAQTLLREPLPSQSWKLTDDSWIHPKYDFSAGVPELPLQYPLIPAGSTSSFGLNLTTSILLDPHSRERLRPFVSYGEKTFDGFTSEYLATGTQYTKGPFSIIGTIARQQLDVSSPTRPTLLFGHANGFTSGAVLPAIPAPVLERMSKSSVNYGIKLQFKFF